MAFEPIKEESAVIHRLSQDWIILQDETMRLDSMMNRVKSRLDVSNAKKRNALLQGIPVEILQEGKQWRKGKIRVNISIEFCPDSIEEEVSVSPELELNKQGPLTEQDFNWPPSETIN